MLRNTTALPLSVRRLLILILLLVLAPICVSAASYWLSDRRGNWQAADRSSAGILPAPADHPDALIRVFAARTVSWRGIFAVHSWIVVKAQNAPRYSRYDYTAWGEPIRLNGFPADGRWFGAMPDTVLAVDGADAARLIPKLLQAIDTYKFRRHGDYSAWPGPNSNTFTRAALDAVPELNGVLPPTAIGKDYPYDGIWLRRTPSGLGVQLSLGGYLGLTVGWFEGLEINLLGAVIGIDLRRPALKLPGIGRLGWPQSLAT